MSGARELTPKQKRASLSNIVKKKKKTPIRNVYAHPRNEFWPVLDADDEKTIVDLIKGLLPSEAINRKLSNKTEREPNISKKKKNPSSKEEQGSLSLMDRKHIRSLLVVGLREVIVAIERDQLKCLLLSKEVDPPYLGHIIGNLASASNVPYIVISNLREVLEGLLGFKSWCMGLLDTPDNYFKQLYEKVQEICNELQKSECESTAVSGSESNLKSSSKANKVVSKTKQVGDLHLYRTDRSKRVFVPESESNRPNEISTSFLKFSKDNTDAEMSLQETYNTSHPGPRGSLKSSGDANSSKSKLQQAPRYFQPMQLLPLQVKRFQGNPNKHKWRTESRNTSKKVLQKKVEDN